MHYKIVMYQDWANYVMGWKIGWLEDYFNINMTVTEITDDKQVRG